MSDFPADPFDLFAQWMEEAESHEPNDPNAMALATVDASGQPSVRMVLLKGVDSAEHHPRGFVFYTNLESNKGLALATHHKAGLCFHWKSLKRQIRIDGPVEPVSDEEADAYFASRARGSQIGAWASRQSRPLEGRWALEKEVARCTARFHIGSIPRPPFWSGFRVVPVRMEFWEDRPYRLHERFVYTPGSTASQAWQVTRLFP